MVRICWNPLSHFPYQTSIPMCDRAITVSLLQARLSRDLPEAFAEKFPSLSSDAQRAIQFTRSTPGITAALVGMSQAAHVAENLGLAAVPPLPQEEYLALYQGA